MYMKKWPRIIFLLKFFFTSPTVFGTYCALSCDQKWCVYKNLLIKTALSIFVSFEVYKHVISKTSDYIFQCFRSAGTESEDGLEGLEDEASLREGILHLYILSYSSPILMLTRCAWNNYLLVGNYFVNSFMAI